MALQLPAEFEIYMTSRLGTAYPDFLRSLEDPPCVGIRYNPKKTSEFPGEQVPWSQYGRYLRERPVFTLDPTFHAGAYYVQDASSMFLEQAVRHSVDLSKPLNVLDLCAAPGGKSTHALSLLSSKSLLISNETIRSRASVLLENIQKWGLDNVIVTSNDPSDFQRLTGFFDLIIADVPCSGEGLFRKEREAIKAWTSNNVEHCSLRQRRIISDVWPSLKVGGVLIYSTCTYNEKENIENLTWLESQHEVEFIQLSPMKDWGIETLEKGPCIGYQLYPHRVKGEGFFLAAIRKKEGRLPSLQPKDSLKFPSPNQIKEFSNWITGAEMQCFFLHHQTVRMIPGEHKDDLQLALNNLNVLSAGTAVLEIKKNKFVPDHALALSIKIRKENFETLSLTREQALDYLRKNNLSVATTRIGFARIEFEGFGLGWVNVLQNRINNLYPASWRIRMGYEDPIQPTT